MSDERSIAGRSRKGKEDRIRKLCVPSEKREKAGSERNEYGGHPFRQFSYLPIG
jgi:hypothetical protein